MTCGADLPENMAAASRAYVNTRAIKLKLTGELVDAERVRAVREARMDVWLAVDANQGFTRVSRAPYADALGHQGQTH
jgi:L-alanine-DL-glutamate epimerase-like enolase superfamily enzyme